ncbi:aminotransferase class I/II-fold pyridoxal phosphate-dependent enzyme [Nesterenkonia sp. HG001]|uniref:aminotransferase class I/II-fold pyridoxal phosphate-dependent enzyme n=1 Tax=Nesterenkonia sp. HG001 TaxID=2983207 RepID=UPI002AC64CB0|nr:aminotransferase class I/II-fold pyridoxal phosphate-dependent enzyme [Nesterenkonia sp. HG001]MDZ5078057.1 aminotransferase class I/II-fold pyridoxal phosphate-dependent enzyme [Nesterenkonia sp. HG001]
MLSRSGHQSESASAALSRVPLDHRPLWAKAAIGANTFDFETATVLPTIYERTTAAALAHDAVNLGQGFPDREGPDWLQAAAAEAITDPQVGPPNQYAPGLGLPVLREAVAEDHRRRYDVTLDPAEQVMITTGATEGITAAILAFAEPGSEVLTFEPHYDSYGACTALAGAELKGVPLRAPDFRPDVDALEAAVTDRTSLILLNTPHNPTGTVFSPEELRRVVDIARRHGLRIMCDEVYEHLVFDDATHRHRTILSVPGAQEVAVAVGSAGKSFSLTGWKVGWITGSTELLNKVRGVKQFLSFSSGPAYQWAIAQGLRDDRGFFAANAAALAAGRDLLRGGLREAGLRPNRAEAGYFVVADIAEVTELSGPQFCEVLTREVGVAAIPVAALTIQHRASTDDELQRLVRFAFCKEPRTIEEAMRRLRERLPAALG